jgi:hypothetical protein
MSALRRAHDKNFHKHLIESRKSAVCPCRFRAFSGAGCRDPAILARAASRFALASVLVSC